MKRQTALKQQQMGGQHLEQYDVFNGVPDNRKIPDTEMVDGKSSYHLENKLLSYISPNKPVLTVERLNQLLRNNELNYSNIIQYSVSHENLLQSMKQYLDLDYAIASFHTKTKIPDVEQFYTSHAFDLFDMMSDQHIRNSPVEVNLKENCKNFIKILLRKRASVSPALLAYLDQQTDETRNLLFTEIRKTCINSSGKLNQNVINNCQQKFGDKFPRNETLIPVYIQSLTPTPDGIPALLKAFTSAPR